MIDFKIFAILVGGAIAFTLHHAPASPAICENSSKEGLQCRMAYQLLKTTHRGLDEPKGMPNPDLADFQIKQVVAYLLSVHQR